MLMTWLDHLAHQATLGANSWADLIVVGIVFTLIIGGAVANGVRNIASKIKANQGRRFSNPSAGSHASQQDIPRMVQQTPRERMGAAAAQRRAQLEKLRAFQAQQQGAKPPTAPGNLTTAQKAARDRARQAFERRAEQMAQQQQARDAAARQRTSSQRSQQASATKTQAPASQQARPQRPQPQVRQNQPVPNRPRIQRTPNATAIGAIGSSTDRSGSSMTPSSSRPRVQNLAGRGVIAEDSLQVHYDETHHSETAAKFRQALTGKSLRAALVLKEILDRPTALREPTDLPGETLYY